MAVNPPKIAAALICKNSAKTLEACLDSIRPFVDAVYIYDTGSTDGTFRLIEKLNRQILATAKRETGEMVGKLKAPPAKERADCIYLPLAPITIERGEWRDDFAWAREQSFAMVPDDFEFNVWLDDDDVVANAHQLRVLAQSAPPELDGFVFFYDYAQDEHGNCVCQLWRERLMRRSAGYKWQCAVHEVLVPPEGKPSNLAMVQKEQIWYIHKRPPDRYPPTRNLEILLAAKERAEAEGKPLDPRTIAYLGTEQMARGQFQEAAGYFQAYLEHPEAGWTDERAQVHHKLATCLRLIGNPLAAVEVEWQAYKERGDWAETHCGLAESFAVLGQWNRVEEFAKRALELGMPQSMLILNPLEFTFLPLIRLAEAYGNLGRWQEASATFAQAAQILPDNPQLQERLAVFEQARFEHEVTEAALKLREVCVRYDENLKAYSILENVPYVIAERPEIVKARADQREMVKHYLRPEEYARWYQDEPKESTLLDEHIDLVGEMFGRVKGLLDGLAEQEAELGRKPIVLDLGCNDWWMGEALARKGYRCDGVELNRTSYEKAIERKERFSRDATIVHGDLHNARKLLTDIYHYPEPPRFEPYDAVSLFEVIEHVPDIEKTLKVCESLLRPGGRIYVSTPDGAFENGQLPNWAKVERKGHLRAIPIHELAEMISARGEVKALHVGDGDRVTFCGYIPKKRKGTVTLYAGAGWEPWSPASIREGGLGGSETALVQVATRFAQAGYRTKVYSGAEQGLYGGALWRPHTAWDPTEETDLLIVSRMPHVFDNQLGARKTALWCHDHSYPGILTEDRAAKIDSIITLSNWQRDRFARLYPFAQNKLQVIRNGISFREWDGEDVYIAYQREYVDRFPRCIYSSSADRGLDRLLELWPLIREQVPKAELHVFYGWDVFDRVALTQPHLMAYKARVIELTEACGGEEGGVFMRGRVGQRELADEMMKARVWSYPTAFLETSCIGAMEARAAGLVPITSDLAALKESVGPHGIQIPWGGDEDAPHNHTPEYGKVFVDHVVRSLIDEEFWTKWSARARRGTAKLDWSEPFKDWLALAGETQAKRKRKPRALVAA
jgi:2-polyprenyl-3-methyl-5-hydroxy-6-metoxy-1,4-benzoquinol methylase/glycosyltransferase involved in cell wall biosynthesis